MSKGNALPATWTRVPLGELGKWYGGGTPSKAVEAFWKDGEVPWFSPKDMKSFRLHSSEDRITRAAVERGNADLFKAGTVLMVVRSGILAHTFPVSIAAVEGTMNQDLKGLAPSHGIYSSYVAYALRNLGRDILHSCSKEGTTVHSIETAALHRFEIPIAPTKEQRRIVRKLDELLSDLDAGVVALERARANLKRYRAAVLKAAVEGRLTEKWRAAHPDVEPASKLLERILAERRKRWEAAQFKKYADKGQSPPKGWKEKYPEPVKPAIGLPKLPIHWTWATLDQLLIEPLSNGRSVLTADVGFPVLRLTALKSGSVDCAAYKIGAWTRDEARAFIVKEGDFLIARGNGSLRLVGRGGLVRKVDREVAYPDTMIRASVSSEPGLRDLIGVLWDSSFVRQQIEGSARTSAGIYKVAQGDLQAICIPLPPREELACAVEMMERMQSICDAVAAELDAGDKRSAALRQAILKRAFEGKLVRQDPKDEPASELLARIRAARGVGVDRRRQRRSSLSG